RRLSKDRDPVKTRRSLNGESFTRPPELDIAGLDDNADSRRLEAARIDVSYRRALRRADVHRLVHIDYALAAVPNLTRLLARPAKRAVTVEIAIAPGSDKNGVARLSVIDASADRTARLARAAARSAVFAVGGDLQRGGGG